MLIIQEEIKLIVKNNTDKIGEIIFRTSLSTHVMFPLRARVFYAIFDSALNQTIGPADTFLARKHRKLWVQLSQC